MKNQNEQAKPKKVDEPKRAEVHPHAPTPPKTEKKVDQVVEDSFPASDPPSWSPSETG